MHGLSMHGLKQVLHIYPAALRPLRPERRKRAGPAAARSPVPPGVLARRAGWTLGARCARVVGQDSVEPILPPQVVRPPRASPVKPACLRDAHYARLAALEKVFDRVSPPGF